MKSNNEIKNRALKTLEDKWVISAICTFAYVFIMQIPSIPSSFSQTFFNDLFSILAILLLPLSYGFYILFLDAVRGRKIEFMKMFDGFKDYIRILTTTLLLLVYTFLWTLLLIVPGIVKNYSYAMTYFILKDEPQLSNNAAIEKSMKMMSGNKMKLFLLDLSFIG